jgi:hypothetical protein
MSVPAACSCPSQSWVVLETREELATDSIAEAAQYPLVRAHTDMREPHLEVLTCSMHRICDGTVPLMKRLVPSKVPSGTFLSRATPCRPQDTRSERLTRVSTDRGFLS